MKGNPVRAFFGVAAARLAGVGVIDAERGRRISDLAWPRFLTVFARRLNQVADVAMIGMVLGPAAIAGLAFASIYWGLASGLALGVAGGTINQVSQRFGAERFDELDLAVKQSVWVVLAITVPIVAGYWLFTEPLIALVGRDPAAIGFGAAYLHVLCVGLLFNAVNLVSSRTLAGADDTWIAMTVRASGAVINIVLNVIFIFGLGMGVEGAALGTVLAEGAITAGFAVGFLTGRLPIMGPFPVTLSVHRPYFDAGLTRHLLTITPPIMVEKLGRSLARFPLFALLALFSPTVVAAFEVGRRLRNLMRSTGSGFSMAASSLVGQELGRGDEDEAGNYAGDVTRFSAAVYLSVGVVVFAVAGPLATLFADDPSAVAQTEAFIRVATVSFLGMGMNATYRGILKAAGDNRWPMYGRLVGQYLVMLPLTYLGTVTPLGVVAVYLAMIGETGVAAAVTGHRCVSGKWKVVSRAHRPVAADD